MRLILLLTSLLLINCGDSPGEPDAAPAPNGSPCDETVMCENECVDAYSDDTAISGGMCTNVCNWEDVTSCTEEEDCLRYTPTQEFYCYQLCEVNDDCRPVEDDSGAECDGTDHCDWDCVCIDFFCSIRACIPPL